MSQPFWEGVFPQPAKSLDNLYELLSVGTGIANVLYPVFDYNWMKEKYDLPRSVSSSTFILHYLNHVRQLQVCPSPYFNEAFYLESEPEVQQAVANGVFCSGYEHFLLHGMREWRPPFAAFEPHFYFNENMRDVAGDSSLCPFVHFLRNRGARRLRISAPLAAREVSEEAGKAIYERRCATNADAFLRTKMAKHDTPQVSVIIVVRDSFEQTANCIMSTLATGANSLEFIIFDNASADRTRDAFEGHDCIKYIRSDKNVGFTIAVNRAAELATGDVLLLINNDVEVGPGTIDHACKSLGSDPSIGALGAKVIRMHGLLQEAGSIVWQDGTCLGYARDKDPSWGQWNFVRDVDFCSGCFLAIRRTTWIALSGFDEAFAPAYYEETDFCLRLWGAGLRVVYDPAVFVWHYEYGSSSLREEPLALMRRNQRYFVKKHRAYLSRCCKPSLNNIESARLRLVSKKRVLFVEDRVPDPTIGMGFVRSAQIAEVISEISGLVSIAGLHDQTWPSASSFSSRMPKSELLTNVNVTNFPDFLNSRTGVYNTLWLSRTHNLSHLNSWKKLCPEFFVDLRVVLDTEAISSSRVSSYQTLTDQSTDLDALLEQELEHVFLVDHICAVNEVDKMFILAHLERGSLDIPVSILGHSLSPAPKALSFAETTDVVLVGSFADPEGPNADGLRWFDKEVRPLVPNCESLRFVIAGYNAEKFVNGGGLKHHYSVTSNPPDMSSVYKSARVMVAPTRFAAGMPMKVHEAASFGVPVVMTDLLANQLGWLQSELGVAPPFAETFARVLLDIAQHEPKWRRAQTTQYQLIQRDCCPAGFRRRIEKLL